MTDIDFTALPEAEAVLHFGGRPSEVDSFTFSNTLLAISEAIQEINRQINPDFALEITIDGVGTGSFRARLNTSARTLAGLFKHRYAETIVIGLLVNFIYAKLSPDAPIKIIVNDDSYIVERGADRVILPRDARVAEGRIHDPKAIERHVNRAFSVLNDDASVSDFGFAGRLADDRPIALIPRDQFAILAQPAPSIGGDRRQEATERTRLIVLRAVLERGQRRWQFAWNNIRISAPITDTTFFDKLASHEHEFGQGDILDVDLKIIRARDDISGAFINESYEVIKVHALHKPARQPQLIPSD